MIEAYSELMPAQLANLNILYMLHMLAEKTTSRAKPVLFQKECHPVQV